MFNASTTSGQFDIFGGFFTRVWSALKTTWSSMESLTAISGEAVGNIPFINNQFRSYLGGVIGAIIIVMIVIGIFAHLVAKSDRL